MVGQSTRRAANGSLPRTRARSSSAGKSAGVGTEGDAKKGEKVAEPKNSEKVAEPQKSEKVANAKKGETAADAKKSEKVADAKKGETAADAKRSEKVADERRLSEREAPKDSDNNAGPNHGKQGKGGGNSDKKRKEEDENGKSSKPGRKRQKSEGREEGSTAAKPGRKRRGNAGQDQGGTTVLAGQMCEKSEDQDLSRAVVPGEKSEKSENGNGCRVGRGAGGKSESGAQGSTAAKPGRKRKTSEKGEASDPTGAGVPAGGQNHGSTAVTPIVLPMNSKHGSAAVPSENPDLGNTAVQSHLPSTSKAAPTLKANRQEAVRSPPSPVRNKTPKKRGRKPGRKAVPPDNSAEQPKNPNHGSTAVPSENPDHGAVQPSTAVQPMDSKHASTAVQPMDSKHASTAVQPMDSKHGSTAVPSENPDHGSTAVQSGLPSKATPTRKRNRQGVERFSPSPIRSSTGEKKEKRGRKAGRKAKSKEGEEEGDEDPKLKRQVYQQYLQKVKLMLQQYQKEEHTIAVFQAEGWKGSSREKVQLTDELARASASQARCHARIRACVRSCEEVQGFQPIPQDHLDPDGCVAGDNIFCGVCLSKDVEEGNDIILCDGPCNRAYHEKCMDPPVDSRTLDEEIGWLCYACDCKEDIVDLVNEELGSNFDLETPWQDIFPAVSNRSKAPSTSKDPLPLPTDNPSDLDLVEAGQNGGENSTREGRSRRRSVAPASSGGHVNNNGLLGLDLPSDDEEDDEDFDVGERSDASESEHSCAEEHGSKAPSPDNPSPSPAQSDSDADEDEDVKLEPEAVPAAEEAVEVVEGKRRRPTVDYRLLHDQMFGVLEGGGLSDEDDDDEEFDPESGEGEEEGRRSRGKNTE